MLDRVIQPILFLPERNGFLAHADISVCKRRRIQFPSVERATRRTTFVAQQELAVGVVTHTGNYPLNAPAL
jgi:hypothetical protein